MSDEARTLPHSLDAEQSVLGGILLAGSKLAEVSGLLKSEALYHPAHRAIYAAMLALEADSQPVDALTVLERMLVDRSDHTLRAMGGEAYFATLTSAVVTVENLGHYARIVHGKHLVRRCIEAAQGIAQAGYGDHGDALEYIAEAEKAISAIAMDAAGGSASYRPIRDVLRDSFRAVEERYKRKQVVTGVPWGWECLDEQTGGMHPGQSIIVAGRPKMGKTSLVMGAVEAAATGKNVNKSVIPTLVISLEMGDAELGERMTSARGGIDGRALRTGQMEQGDWIRFTRAAGELAQAPISIFDGVATFPKIRSLVRRWRARETQPGQLALVVVDYLQLIQSEQRKRQDNREQEIAGWSRGFKLLAKEIAAPVVVLSQLNRGVEQRADKRPMVSDLRESGAIEQDADLILLLYRDEVYNAESRYRGIAEVIIGAGRHVPAGTLYLKFQGAYTRFTDCPESDLPEPEQAQPRARKGNGRGGWHPYGDA